MDFKLINQYKKGIALCVILNLANVSFSQSKDSTSLSSFFSGSVLVTNNGISLVPSLSLEKPATIFNMSMSKGRLSFDPELRFSLEGKPWSFLFWWRYKLVQTEKFKFSIGTHPSFIFKNKIATIDGVSKNVLITTRYWASEFVPSYNVGKNISLGIYYLYSRGLDDFATTNTHFLSLNSNFSNIKLSDQFFMTFRPQVFYLKLDENDGVYVSSLLTLAKNNFPITISSITTKTIQSNIVSKDFVWNVSVIYSF